MRVKKILVTLLIEIRGRIVKAGNNSKLRSEELLRGVKL